MNNLSKIIEQINKEFRIDSEGKSFVSIRGAARLAGVHDSALFRAIQSAAQNPSGLINFLVGQGFDLAVPPCWSSSLQDNTVSLYDMLQPG
jgi:hypothetical protein